VTGKSRAEQFGLVVSRHHSKERLQQHGVAKSRRLQLRLRQGVQERYRRLQDLARAIHINRSHAGLGRHAIGRLPFRVWRGLGGPFGKLHRIDIAACVEEASDLGAGDDLRHLTDCLRARRHQAGKRSNGSDPAMDEPAPAHGFSVSR